MDKQIIEISPSEKEAQIQSNATLLSERASSLEVWDDESAIEATDLTKLVSTQLRLVEDERKLMVKPLNDHVKYINARFKRYSDPLSEVLTILKGKILRHQQEQRAIAARQAEIARQEAARKAAEEEELKKNAAHHSENELVIEEPTPQSVAVVSGPVRGSFGTTSIRKRWTWEIVDFALVPDAYKQIASASVTAAVRDGAREVPGLRIFETEELSVR